MNESNQTPDVAAELARLVIFIDTLLAEETADRQSIAEEASARLKKIATAAADSEAQARRVLDEAIAAALAAFAEKVSATHITATTDDLNRDGAALAPPLATAQQARELPAVQAAYEAFGADPGPGKMAPHNRRILLDACSAAGVELGAYDLQIVGWMASWEPATCAVVAGLITRAAHGPATPEEAVKAAVAALAEPHRDTLRQVFADGIAYRTALFAESATCAECARYPLECAEHQNQRDTAAVFRNLAAAFGIDPDADSWDDQ